MGKDLRFALRMATRNPGVSAAAVVALSLGIGANSALFSLVNGVLLRPLPYPRPDDVVVIRESRPQQRIEQTHLAPREFFEFRRQCQSIEQLAAFTYENFSLVGVADPQRLGGLRVTANFFDSLEVRPALGRTFRPAEETPGQERVAVLGRGFWKRQFGADPGILGRTITLNDNAYAVIGVMPEAFEFTSVDFDVFLPVVFAGMDVRALRIHAYEVIGRLRPGANLGQARAELTSIAARLEKDSPATNAGHRVYLARVHEETVREVRPMLLLLLGAVGFVLLIACSNVAGLLVARAAGRAREMAVRTALGAGRWRIVRQLLSESLVLSLAGGSLGLLLAWWGVRGMLAFSPETIPRAGRVALDWNVALFTCGISVATGVLFGLAPALRASKANWAHEMREGGRSATAGSRHQRVRSLLVVAQIALSLMLLIGAGLTLQTLSALRKLDPGFQAKNVLTMRMALMGSQFASPLRQVEFYRQVLSRVAPLPGVETVGATTVLPLGGSFSVMPFTVEGKPSAPNEMPRANLRAISPGYPRAMGIRLLAGRTFTEGDKEDSLPVVILNRTAASRHWPREDPIGKRIQLGRDSKEPWRTVVGVVNDVKHLGLRSESRDEIYVPFPQFPMPAVLLVVRTLQEPGSLAGAVREQIRKADPNQPVHEVRTMQNLLEAATENERITSFLLACFAGLAVIMASLGVYSIMTHMVAQRRHEIGIRLAVGAQPANVVTEILRHVMLLTAAGLAAGSAGAFAIRGVLDSILYGIKPTDLSVWASVTLLLAFVSMAAGYLPLRAAARVDPMTVLRHE